ncbi:MAG: flagellar hook assembly protein FlgD [Pseudobdellovibrionaceae bacterium]
MNTKMSTKAFGDNQSLPFNNNPVRNVSASDQQKIGDDRVGEVLNKISDPNWTDPTKKVRTAGNDKLDKDAFFKLMLAQMKNQDPTSPLKSHEMAAQLASFSSLEQMQNMNKTMTDLRNAQRPSENFQALNLLGKSVAGDSSKVTRVKGDNAHDFRFDLANDAQEVNIKVRDDQGEIVRALSFKNLKKGENRISWNGMDDRGTAVREGNYDFFAEAKGSDSKKIAIKTDFAGLINGVNYSSDGPVLMVGNQSIRWKDVKQIMDPGLTKNDQKSADPANLDLKSQPAVPQNENKAVSPTAPAQAEAGGGSRGVPPMMNLNNSVGLSREMMNKLAKEVK